MTEIGEQDKSLLSYNSHAQTHILFNGLKLERITRIPSRYSLELILSLEKRD
jgi:hypothetical protein